MDPVEVLAAWMRREADAVGRDLEGPASSMALWWHERPGFYTPVAVSWESLRLRQARLAAWPDPDDWHGVWDPEEHDRSVVLDEGPPDDLGRGYFDAARRLEAAVQDRYDEPVDFLRWLLDRACRALTREPPAIEVTDDFVAFTHTGEGPEETLMAIEFAATPGVLERLTSRGLLLPTHLRDEDHLEDSRPPWRLPGTD